jgi:hypothetical protein
VEQRRKLWSLFNLCDMDCRSVCTYRALRGRGHSRNMQSGTTIEDSNKIRYNTIHFVSVAQAFCRSVLKFIDSLAPGQSSPYSAHF